MTERISEVVAFVGPVICQNMVSSKLSLTIRDTFLFLYIDSTEPLPGGVNL